MDMSELFIALQEIIKELVIIKITEMSDEEIKQIRDKFGTVKCLSDEQSSTP